MHSKLNNTKGDFVKSQKVFKVFKIEYLNTLKEYELLKLDSNYNTYLILLNNGRCFKISLLKDDSLDINQINYNLISVGYYQIKNPNIGVEIYGNTSGGYFGFSEGEIYENSIILKYIEKKNELPRYITYYEISDININILEENW